MIQDATIRVTLFKSKTLANGEHPLMLCVTKNGKRKYQALGISCKPNEWDSEKCRPRKNHPDKLKIEAIIDKRVAELRDKALDYKVEEKDFTSEGLVRSVKKPKGTADVFAFFEEIIERLTIQKKIGNANVYRDTQRALKAFLPKTKALSFTEIDLGFLNRFETHLRGKDLAETTLSVYFRTLRALMNKAKKEGLIGTSHYPFAEFKVSKFDTRTRKRAITKADIRKIEAVDVSDKPQVQLAKDVFLFSYYSQGINLTDIALLRWSNILEGRIFYTRAKTGKDFNLKLLPPALEIVERYRMFTGGNSGNYVFPILDAERHITPTQKDSRIHKLTGQINRGLKEIAVMAGIDVSLTTYVARHTYATVLKTSGVPIAVISEALGHESEGITHTYLKSFENEVIEAANEHLL
ncbi:MAG: site-specific integrase [Saprospirales bacterium]|nr:site-specific integrase [Saprospirales bacterium]